mmetsp:Transcript_33783/g.54819  ORF Transcript_33783/g.54819 Transcript_33783/m.54819 type:complete len:250 (-) Transcript_33783:701-1450(-)
MLAKTNFSSFETANFSYLGKVCMVSAPCWPASKPRLWQRAIFLHAVMQQAESHPADEIRSFWNGPWNNVTSRPVALTPYLDAAIREVSSFRVPPSLSSNSVFLGKPCTAHVYHWDKFLLFGRDRRIDVPQLQPPFDCVSNAQFRSSENVAIHFGAPVYLYVVKLLEEARIFPRHILYFHRKLSPQGGNLLQIIPMHEVRNCCIVRRVPAIALTDELVELLDERVFVEEGLLRKRLAPFHHRCVLREGAE